MSDKWVLHASYQPGQKETYCFPSMKAGSQRNLDEKKNMFVLSCNLFRTQVHLFAFLIASMTIYVYVQCMYMCTPNKVQCMLWEKSIPYTTAPTSDNFGHHGNLTFK